MLWNHVLVHILKNEWGIQVLIITLQMEAWYKINELPQDWDHFLTITRMNYLTYKCLFLVVSLAYVFWVSLFSLMSSVTFKIVRHLFYKLFLTQLNKHSLYKSNAINGSGYQNLFGPQGRRSKRKWWLKTKHVHSIVQRCSKNFTSPQSLQTAIAVVCHSWVVGV